MFVVVIREVFVCCVLCRIILFRFLLIVVMLLSLFFLFEIWKRLFDIFVLGIRRMCMSFCGILLMLCRKFVWMVVLSWIVKCRLLFWFIKFLEGILDYVWSVLCVRVFWIFMIFIWILCWRFGKLWILCVFWNFLWK